MSKDIHKKKHLSSFQLIILGFAGVILLGAIILMLPVSSAEGVITPFNQTLFTSTSAVCVTGLAVLASPGKGKCWHLALDTDRGVLSKSIKLEDQKRIEIRERSIAVLISCEDVVRGIEHVETAFAEKPAPPCPYGFEKSHQFMTL